MEHIEVSFLYCKFDFIAEPTHTIRYTHTFHKSFRSFTFPHFSTLFSCWKFAMNDGFHYKTEAKLNFSLWPSLMASKQWKKNVDFRVSFAIFSCWTIILFTMSPFFLFLLSCVFVLVMWLRHADITLKFLIAEF